jgi:chromosome partitioning protein
LEIQKPRNMATLVRRYRPIFEIGLSSREVMMRTIACLNWKGGSGKSTTALSLAVGLAQRVAKRQRVLLVDNDPQANATMMMLDGADAETPTLTDVLLEDVDAAEAIRPTRVDRLDVLPADGRLAELTALLAEEEMGRERRLRIALKSVESSYSFCIVDSPPQLSLLTVNILQAVSEVLVPIDPGLFAVAGLGRLQETVERVRHYLEHPDLAIIGLLFTKATKSKVSLELLKQLREAYGDLVYQTVIPASATVEEAHANYRTIMEWAPRSPAAQAYGDLVTEVLKHGQPKRVARKRGSRRGNAA